MRTKDSDQSCQDKIVFCYPFFSSMNASEQQCPSAQFIIQHELSIIPSREKNSYSHQKEISYYLFFFLSYFFTLTFHEKREENMTIPFRYKQQFIQKIEKVTKCQLDFVPIVYMPINKIFIRPLRSFIYVQEKRIVLIQ